MPGDFDITVSSGVDQIEKLGKDLRAAGAKDLKKELMRSGRALKVPFAAAVKAHATKELPKKGGLNLWVANRIKITSSVRLSGEKIGVRFKTSHRSKEGLSDLPALNAGKARHPLYGDTDHWYFTVVPAGFVGHALDEMGDTMRAQFLQAVDEVARKLAAGG